MPLKFIQRPVSRPTILPPGWNNTLTNKNKNSIGLPASGSRPNSVALAIKKKRAAAAAAAKKKQQAAAKRRQAAAKEKRAVQERKRQAFLNRPTGNLKGIAAAKRRGGPTTSSTAQTRRRGAPRRYIHKGDRSRFSSSRRER